MAQRAGARKSGGRGRKGNGRNGAAKPGHNSGEVPAEIIQRHWATIGSALRAHSAAAEIMKKRKSVLSNAYKAAKGDGIDPDVLKAARKMLDGDHAQAVLAHRDQGRVLEVVVGDLEKELPLLAPIYRDFKMPAPVNAYLAGQQAGREGAPSDDNPHTPGSELFQQWSDGHTNGAELATDSFRRPDAQREARRDTASDQ